MKPRIAERLVFPDVIVPSDQQCFRRYLPYRKFSADNAWNPKYQRFSGGDMLGNARYRTHEGVTYSPALRHPWLTRTVLDPPTCL
jgi:hypothetical protein